MPATCGHSTGSATGCQPLCDRPATTNVVLDLPCYGEVAQLRCAGHVRAAVAQAYPHRTEVRAL